jgi:Holliday junction resolvase RusA-like endonuclease
MPPCCPPGGYCATCRAYAARAGVALDLPRPAARLRGADALLALARTEQALLHGSLEAPPPLRPQHAAALLDLERTSQAILASRETVTLTLPYPPSVNKHHVPVNGRLVTRKSHKEYVANLGWAIAAQHGNQGLRGPLTMTLHLHPPNDKPDIDNGLKVTLDSLKTHGVYGDDKQIKELHIYLHPPSDQSHIAIILTRKDSYAS